MKRLPTFKYIDSKYDSESEARKDWESIYDNVDNLQKEHIWSRTKFGQDANAFKNHRNYNFLEFNSIALLLVE